jgi:hypothetical protein
VTSRLIRAIERYFEAEDVWFNACQARPYDSEVAARAQIAKSDASDALRTTASETAPWFGRASADALRESLTALREYASGKPKILGAVLTVEEYVRRTLDSDS